MIDNLISDPIKKIWINLELYFERNKISNFFRFFRLFLDFSEFFKFFLNFYKFKIDLFKLKLIL